MPRSRNSRSTATRARPTATGVPCKTTVVRSDWHSTRAPVSASTRFAVAPFAPTTNPLFPAVSTNHTDSRGSRSCDAGCESRASWSSVRASREGGRSHAAVGSATRPTRSRDASRLLDAAVPTGPGPCPGPGRSAKSRAGGGGERPRGSRAGGGGERPRGSRAGGGGERPRGSLARSLGSLGWSLAWSLGSHPPCAATPPRVHPCGGAPLPPSLGGGMSYRRPAPPLSPRNVQSSVSRTVSTSETNGGGGPVPDLYPTTHASTYASHSCRDGGVLDTTPS